MARENSQISSALLTPTRELGNSQLKCSALTGWHGMPGGRNHISTAWRAHSHSNTTPGQVRNAALESLLAGRAPFKRPMDSHSRLCSHSAPHSSPAEPSCFNACWARAPHSWPPHFHTCWPKYCSAGMPRTSRSNSGASITCASGTAGRSAPAAGPLCSEGVRWSWLPRHWWVRKAHAPLFQPPGACRRPRPRPNPCHTHARPPTPTAHTHAYPRPALAPAPPAAC